MGKNELLTRKLAESRLKNTLLNVIGFLNWLSRVNRGERGKTVKRIYWGIYRQIRKIAPLHHKCISRNFFFTK